MSNKHDANVRKSALVNFQIGLVASLLFTYVMFEVYTAVPVIDTGGDPEPMEYESFVWDQRFQVYEEPQEVAVVKEKPVKPIVNPTKFEIVSDDTPEDILKNEFKNITPEATTPVKVSDVIEAPDEVNIEVPFNKVEFVPVFPGCEGLSSNKERSACFTQKIKKIVSKKFDSDLGAELGLQGLQRIYVQFDVFKDGTIQNVKARAPHPALEKEAKRVVGKFPVMTPGRQRDKNVTVRYQLPIVFNIQN